MTASWALAGAVFLTNHGTANAVLMTTDLLPQRALQAPADLRRRGGDDLGRSGSGEDSDRLVRHTRIGGAGLRTDLAR